MVWGSRLTCFLCKGLNWLRCCTGAEITCFIEIDLVLPCGPKMICSQWGIDWLGFCVGGRIWLVFLGGQKSLGFSVRFEHDFISAWVVEIDLVWKRGMNLTWFQCRDRNWPCFCVGIGHDMVSCLDRNKIWFVSRHHNRLELRGEIEIDLISVVGRKYLGFCLGDRLH